MKRNLTPTLFVVLFVCVQWHSAQAKNVDLSTLPSRENVELTIYNSEDLTLVRERRQVSFKKGINSLQFSWANTLIDPTSVDLRFVDHSNALELLDTTFPHDKPHMLYWNVRSHRDGQGMVEITYFTSGITWAADYTSIANVEESRMDVEGFVRVYNHSGEEYDGARVRLVVGTINLVEKIAELARVPMAEVADLKTEIRKDLRFRAAKRMMGREVAAVAGNASTPVEEKSIIKEGLSEYFIYTIEGTETIPNGWSKRLRSFQVKDVPFEIEYRYRAREYGLHLVRLYLFRNDKPSGLGETPLPDGVIRVFRRNGRGGLTFLVTQTLKYVAVGDQIEVNLGEDPEVVFELIALRSFRDNIWARVGKTRVFRRVDDGRLKVDIDSKVVGWNAHEVYTQRIRNYTGKPIRVSVRRRFSGHVIVRSQLPIRLHDYQTPEYEWVVQAGQKADLLYEVVQLKGRNAKQNNVALQEAVIEWPSYRSGG